MVLYFRLVGSLAGISMAGSSVVILSYLFIRKIKVEQINRLTDWRSTAKLRRHPINLVFFLAIADFFFSLKWVLTSFIDDSQKLETEAVRKNQFFSLSLHTHFTRRFLV